MARHVFNFLHRHDYFRSAELGGGAEADQVIADIRNLFRDGDGSGYADLNVALPSPRWVISDIAKWGTTYDGYAFIIRDTTNGCEWLFGFGGNGGSNSSPLDNVFAGFNQLSNFAQRIHSTPSTTGSAGLRAVLFWYNPDYSVESFADGFGFDDPAALTFVGGDFTAPSTVPDDTTDILVWIPSGAPRGAQHEMDSAYFHDFWIIFDDTEQAMAVYGSGASEEGQANIHAISIHGEVFEPIDPADTNTSGMVWFATSSGDFWASSQLAEAGYATGLDAGGVEVLGWDIKVSGLFTPGNSQNLDGTYRWKPVQVVNSTDFKGWLKDSLAREIAGLGDVRSRTQLFNTPSGPLVKLTEAIAFFWKANLLGPPFAYTSRLENWSY